MTTSRKRSTTSGSSNSASNGLFSIFVIMMLIGCCNMLLFHKFLAEDLKGVIGHHAGLDPNNKRASFTKESSADFHGQANSSPSANADGKGMGKQIEDAVDSLKNVKDDKIQNKSKSERTNQDRDSHETAGLSCSDHGGPSDELAQEMIFWEDIPSDSEYKSPFYDEDKYITFEPDKGGWNNIRMAYETILVLAHATGRTLVLPPEQKMYLLGKGDSKHKKEFSFNDFFHLDSIATEHAGLNIITTEEFLERKGMTGQLKDRTTGKVIKPSKTNWNGEHLGELFQYLRQIGKYPEGWEPSTCFAAIPESSDPKHVDELQSMFDDIMGGKHGKVPKPETDFVDDPVPVDAPAVARMREMLAGRKEICIYDSELQAEPVLHFKVDHKEKARMLTHFYAFIFFQDWKQDTWSKRFVRDHIRYVDEIVCAAARIVNAVRERARKHSSENTKGEYDSFHVRRGDFQYKRVKVSADELYKTSRDQIHEGGSLYIATDERNKEFFNVFKDKYDVSFLDDYMHLIEDINPNYYGMLDQLVAHKGNVFFGTFFSTLSGYVNRMRGYYNAKEKLEGYELGHLKSYYFVPEERKFQMTKYYAIKLPLYMREFPTSWRDIDRGIGEL